MSYKLDIGHFVLKKSIKYLNLIKPQTESVGGGGGGGGGAEGGRGGGEGGGGG